MGKGLGISALILAVIAIGIPLVGPLLTIPAAIIAVFARKDGFGFGVAAFMVSLINLIFLSPSVWLALSEAGSATGAIFIAIFEIGIQIVGLIVLVWWNKKTEKSNTSV